MSIPPDDQPAQDPRLRWLMSDAVSDIEPRDALPAIRSAVHPRTQEAPVPSPSSSARWTYAFTGALLAAAVILAVFLVFDPTGSDSGDDPGPAAGPTSSTSGNDESSTTPTPSPTRDPSKTPEPAGDTGVAAVYYVADTPAGPRLFREFQAVRGVDELDRALRLLQSPPKDPDYLQLWPTGSLSSASYDGTTITVSVGTSVGNLPAELTEERASATVQSAIYTLQGAVKSRAPVRFVLDGRPVDSVLGVPTAEPLANGPVLEVLNLMSVTAPEEGSTQSGSMEVSGVGNSFEATITWRVQDSDGKVVEKGFTTAEGWMEEKLFPWSDTVDLAGLPAGDYLFTASTDDPTGGAEGFGPAVDTKRFTIR